MSFYKNSEHSYLNVLIGSILSFLTTTCFANGEILELDVSFIYLELNSTDQDLGIHTNVDGEAWRKLMIRGPHRRTYIYVTARSGLGRQGLTELFFESDEPEIPGEIDVETILHRAPEGEYRFIGQTVERQRIIGEWELSHVMAAPAQADVSVGGNPWECQGVNPVADVLFIWDEVTEAYGDNDVDPDGLLGDGEDLEDEDEVVLYTLVVEREEDEDAGLPLLVYSVDLPPEAANSGSFEVTVPAVVFSYGGLYKWETIVRTGSHNQTTEEGCITEEE